MPRERIVESFILKRQDFGEADHIVTLFSKEEGKLRAIVKAAKLPTSKLQPMLQPLFQTRITLTGSASGASMPKVIRVQPISVYSGILDSEVKLSAWYIVSELLIRALGDSAPNEALFSETEDYAQFLHETELSAEQIKASVTQFQIRAMRALGLGIHAIPANSNNEQSPKLWFSMDRGGFLLEDLSSDSAPVKNSVYSAFEIMAKDDYSTALNLPEADSQPLSAIVNRFVSYQLEREIKSQRYMV